MLLGRYCALLDAMSDRIIHKLDDRKVFQEVVYRQNQGDSAIG